MTISDFPVTENHFYFYTLQDGQKIQGKFHHTKISTIIKTQRYHSISICKANQKWARVPSIKKQLITCISKLVVASDCVFFT